MRKRIIAILLLTLCLLTACGNAEADITESAATEPTENPLLHVEELMQGTWEFYDETSGFGEILKLDHGYLEYTGYLDAERDKDSVSMGSYRLSDSQLITMINGYESQFDYEIDGDRIAITKDIDSGYDKGKTRVYVQTQKTDFDPARASVNRPVEMPKKPSVDDYEIDKGGNSDFASSGEKNALETAKSYLRYSAFSYEGLIDQLEFEGYTYSEAKYGADNCGADWYDQALKCAESYLKYSAFSKSGLVDQLEYEGFTRDQSSYGVEGCGADWYEQAVKCAESYLKYSSFSRSELIDQLEYEGFTYDQAVYGVNQAY